MHHHCYNSRCYSLLSPTSVSFPQHRVSQGMKDQRMTFVRRRDAASVDIDSARCVFQGKDRMSIIVEELR
jgi:hypothetical protein